MNFLIHNNGFLKKSKPSTVLLSSSSLFVYYSFP